MSPISLDSPPADLNSPVIGPVDAVDHWRKYSLIALEGVPPESILWSETLPGGAHWSWRLCRGTALRFVALDAGANASVVLYAAHNPLERYNMPDSLKAQHTAHYTRGHVLMSDMGRALASITQDSIGWHDPLGGLLDTPHMEAQYGAHRFESHRNGMNRSGKDGLLIEIGKHGLSRRDLIAPVNLFSKVSVDEEGRFHFAKGHSQTGDFVELRSDMDLILAVSTAPHPLDPAQTYSPAKVGVVAWRSGPAAADDVCRTFRPENARAHHNTDQFYL